MDAERWRELSPLLDALLEMDVDTRERQILARLAHPHIARLLDAGISGDHQPYLALEYIEGEPITDFCRNRQLSLESRLGLFAQVCRNRRKRASSDAVCWLHHSVIGWPSTYSSAR